MRLQNGIAEGCGFGRRSLFSSHRINLRARSDRCILFSGEGPVDVIDCPVSSASHHPLFLFFVLNGDLVAG